MFITPMGEKSSTHTVRFVSFSYSAVMVSDIKVELISVVTLITAPFTTLIFSFGILVTISVRSW